MIQRYEREMSISHQDFYRLIPLALKNIDYEIINHGQINANYADGKIEIIPGKEHKRKIASLELPVLFVKFTFIEISSENIASFFNDFSRVYQRGGG
jgi:hypothetical protein